MPGKEAKGRARMDASQDLEATGKEIRNGEARRALKPSLSQRLDYPS